MKKIKLTTKAFKENEHIPAKYAFCKLTKDKKVEMGENLNPDFSWNDLPERTKSLVLICHDSEVPTSAENVNKENKVVPKDLQRTDFYHWILIDIPGTLKGIKEGEFSKGITARGKGKSSLHGTRQGLNNYTDWFKGDIKMEGAYFGYDGPCPPWNDERIHKYHFTLSALDVEKLEIPEESFGGPDVLKAIEGHVLATARISGTYTLNKDLV